MKMFFLSSTPCALSVNGVYFGITDTFERSAEVCLTDNAFIQFTPQNAHPIGFFLTEDIRFRAPVGCDVYLLENAIAVYAREFSPIDTTLRPVCQKRNGNTLATLYFQGSLQFALESEKGAFISTMPPTFETCDLQFYEDFVLLLDEKCVAVFTLDGEKLLQESTLSCAFKNGELSAVLPLSEHLGRTADCAWKLENHTLVRVRYLLKQERTDAPNATVERLQEELLPFAFFESVRIGADISEFLCEELLARKDDLRLFLGSFCALTPTENPNRYALIYKKADGLYQAQYFTLSIENGKITDVQG